MNFTRRQLLTKAAGLAGAGALVSEASPVLVDHIIDVPLPSSEWGWFLGGTGWRIGPVRRDDALIDEAIHDPASGIVGWKPMTPEEEIRFNASLPDIRELHAKWEQS